MKRKMLRVYRVKNIATLHHASIRIKQRSKLYSKKIKSFLPNTEYKGTVGDRHYFTNGEYTIVTIYDKDKEKMNIVTIMNENKEACEERVKIKAKKFNKEIEYRIYRFI